MGGRVGGLAGGQVGGRQVAVVGGDGSPAAPPAKGLRLVIDQARLISEIRRLSVKYVIKDYDTRKTLAAGWRRSGGTGWLVVAMATVVVARCVFEASPNLAFHLPFTYTYVLFFPSLSIGAVDDSPDSGGCGPSEEATYGNISAAEAIKAGPSMAGDKGDAGQVCQASVRPVYSRGRAKIGVEGRGDEAGERERAIRKEAVSGVHGIPSHTLPQRKTQCGILKGRGITALRDTGRRQRRVHHKHLLSYIGGARNAPLSAG
ncbi:hypothetical protein E2C01_050869 [Portunus trituberculatus]|uniref:Uncharacterized protein n=1 Tax=Portunus trituberculatus TaxID=210409 RepID=A0A5B7GD86_PORTR|nr:hypothetical protein [Portunus trituberculatus]